jgi:hypothetical protein
MGCANFALMRHGYTKADFDAWHAAPAAPQKWAAEQIAKAAELAESFRPGMEKGISAMKTADAAPQGEDDRASPPQSPPYWADEVEQRLLTWHQRLMNDDGDRRELADFMDQEAVDDLIDFVCAPLQRHSQ